MVCLISDLMFSFSFARAKKPVKMPGYHYVDRKLDVTNHNKDYTSLSSVKFPLHANLWSPDVFSESNQGRNTQ